MRITIIFVREGEIEAEMGSSQGSLGEQEKSPLLRICMKEIKEGLMVPTEGLQDKDR
jgi:hypothetical protein